MVKMIDATSNGARHQKWIGNVGDIRVIVRSISPSVSTHLSEYWYFTLSNDRWLYDSLGFDCCYFDSKDDAIKAAEEYIKENSELWKS